MSESTAASPSNGTLGPLPEQEASPSNGTSDALPEHQPPGRPLSYLDDQSRDDLLGRIARGQGIDQAIRGLRLSLRSYQNTLQDVAGFRGEVASALRAGHQNLDEFGYHRALSGDVDMLIAVWKRRDKAHYLNLAREDRARERAEDRAIRLRWERIERELARRDRRERLIILEASLMEPGPERDLYLHTARLRDRERCEGRPDWDDLPTLDRLPPEVLAEWREAMQQFRAEIAAELPSLDAVVLGDLHLKRPPEAPVLPVAIDVTPAETP